MKKLDKLDRRILSELDHDSRQSISDIARRLRQGRDRVGYRVDQLTEREIILGFTTSMNIYRLGYTIFKSYLRLESSRESSQALITYLRSHPRVYWYALCDGGWDLMIAVFARNAREFHLIHSEIVTRFNDIVLNFSMYTLIELHLYRMGFLLGKETDHFLIGGELGTETIDQQDYQILKILSDDSRKGLAQIATQIHSTPAVVKYRIARLERQGIISGYTIEPNLEKLDMMFFKAQLFLRNYTSTLREEFREFCQQNPYISCYIEQLGDATLEIELQVHDYEQFNEIIDEIRASFSKLVRNFQTVLIRQARFNWLPRDLVMKDKSPRKLNMA
jgi:DNA-binding Lrp family transcriptional regulator